VTTMNQVVIFTRKPNAGNPSHLYWKLFSRMPYRLYLVTSNPKLSIKVIRNIYTEVYRTTKNLIFFECSI